MKEMDCFRAQKVSSRLSIGGGISAIVGACIISFKWCPHWLAAVVVIVGFATLISGLVIGYRFLICPHCGGPLYDAPRLPSELPTYCPHCGKKIEQPKAP